MVEYSYYDIIYGYIFKYRYNKFNIYNRYGLVLLGARSINFNHSGHYHFVLWAHFLTLYVTFSNINCSFNAALNC